MGEDPKRVFNVGALGIDNIKNTKLLNKKELESRLKFKLGRNNILVAFNSATLEKKDVLLRQLQNLLKAVDSLDDTRVIFTKPNPDLYSKSIIAVIDSYVAQNRDKAISFVSLGRVLYLSLLKQVDLVIGNSSSGIIEVPSFGIPTINIGSRQEGRIMPSSVINAKGALPLIKDALNKALSEKFRKFCKKKKNPYGKGKAAVKIVKILKKATQFNLKKSFLNLDFKTN
jgi:GDP/UDP-N,N'-diacetylbacillosamine 2-epimerase (hydrolysing)